MTLIMQTLASIGFYLYRQNKFDVVSVQFNLFLERKK